MSIIPASRKRALVSAVPIALNRQSRACSSITLTCNHGHTMPDAVYAHHGRNERSPSGDPRRYHEIQRSAAQVRRVSFAPARLGRAPGKLPHPYIYLHLFRLYWS